jgi:hypothetical protein
MEYLKVDYNAILQKTIECITIRNKIDSLYEFLGHSQNKINDDLFISMLEKINNSKEIQLQLEEELKNLINA